MVITCPTCRRRFNLPSSLVRARQAKLKCSKCKATFVQDLGDLIGVASAKLTAEEERLIAALPTKAPPKGPPGAARMPLGARPPAAPVRAGGDTAKQPIYSPAVMMGAPRPGFDENAATKQMQVVTSRRATDRTPSVAPVAPPTAVQPAAAEPAAAAKPAPVVPAAAPARPPPRRAPVAEQPPARVIDGYESYGEAPAVDAEHEEALARAEAAHVELEAARLAFEQAEAEAQARAEAAARAAEEAARAQAAVDAALDDAMREAAEEAARTAAEAAAAEQAQAEHALADAQRAQESYAAQEQVVVGLEQGAAAEAGAEGPPLEGADVPIDVPLDEGPEPPRPAPVTDPRQRALDMFGGVQTPSGRFVLGPTVDVDDVLELSDEERPSPWRWVGLGTAILLLLGLAFFVFVLARNGWKLDIANFGTQIKYAIGIGGPAGDDRTCLAASARMPVLVRGRDGVMVIVRGTINNFCGRSIAGAGITCTLNGPGGPWTDTARPFSSAGASDLTEEELADQTTGAMASAIGQQENSAGVVLPGTTHEFWCTFSNAAGAESRASQFRPSYEVTVP
jgi:predicted Zn finger-like uncharacterized protein